MLVRLGATIGVAAFLAGCASAPYGVQRFNFNTYEFSNDGQDTYGQVPDEIMASRAQAFVNAHHPVGGMASVAVEDFRHAGAACSPDQRNPDHTVCRYARPSHGVTGLPGSAVWRLDVYARPGLGSVSAIIVSRRLAAD